MEAAAASPSTPMCPPLLSPCSQHFLILHLSPWGFHHCCLALSPIPHPFTPCFSSQDPAQPRCCLPCIYNQFYTLPQLSDSLLQAPGFPRSYLHVSLCLAPNKPVLPNRSISFPTLKTNPPLNHLTIPKLQPQLCSSKDTCRKHLTTNSSS